MLACSVIILSNFPLAPSFVFISFCYQIFHERGFWVPDLAGEAAFYRSGQHEYLQQPFLLKKVVFLIDKVGLLFILKDGRRFMLWRDSVDEAMYRHLIVWLKREP